ncbi:hypothetical protein [Bdellovibrio bacteriovorus]|uniref:hypothetical protein n=1 Tax=Bdellovibrio TaxID=958 RepID=UPI0035A8A08E
MKKSILVFIATSVIAGSAFAELSVGTTAGSVLGTAASSADLAELNDLVQVQGDALVALETGVVSPELKSVMEKMRAEIPELQQSTDEEVLSIIVTLSKGDS